MVTVDLPPLRERTDDIVPLVDHFRRQCNKRHGKSVAGISNAVSRVLYAYHWPGNVRQLRNVVESMVVVDQDDRLDTDDLPPELTDEAVETSAGDTGSASFLVGKPLSEIERWAIEQTLHFAGGNREETARILGIGAGPFIEKSRNTN